MVQGWGGCHGVYAVSGKQWALNKYLMKKQNLGTFGLLALGAANWCLWPACSLSRWVPLALVKKEKFLSGFMRGGQEGSAKEKEEKSCHVGTGGVNFFAAYMRTQEPMETCGRELRGGGSWFACSNSWGQEQEIYSWILKWLQLYPLFDGAWRLWVR